MQTSTNPMNQMPGMHTMLQMKHAHSRRVLVLVLTTLIAVLAWYLAFESGKLYVSHQKDLAPATTAERTQAIDSLKEKGFTVDYGYSDSFKKKEIQKIQKSFAPPSENDQKKLKDLKAPSKIPQ